MAWLGEAIGGNKLLSAMAYLERRAMMDGPTRDGASFPATLAEVDVGIRRTFFEAQRTFGETDAQWTTADAQLPPTTQSGPDPVEKSFD